MRALAGTAKAAPGLASARTFELAVSAVGLRRYRLEAHAKTQGRAVAEVAVERLPSPPLSSLLERPTSGEELRQIGHELSCVLFTGDVGRLFERALGEVLAADELSLRLVLRVDPPELAVLPWELLFAAERELFLASSPRTTISRTLPLMLPIGSVAAPVALGCLFIAPRSAGLSTGAEDAAFEQLATALGSRGRVERLVGEVTPEAIRQALREREPDLVHFAGHGSFGEDGSAVYLDGEAGLPLRVPAAAFGELFRDRPPIRLVVLNACEGARRSVEALAGVAPRLLQCGVPAVLAMQSRLTDVDASIFASTFYAELVQGPRLGNVEAALARARGALYADRFPSPIFASPVLYLRTEDGELWRPVAGNRQALATGRETPAAGRRAAGKRAATAQRDAAVGPASLESNKGSAAADAARPPSRTEGPPAPPLFNGREGGLQPMERLAPMTNIAHLVRVFIASPSDVKAERQTVREVIAEWNATHTEDRRIVLMPIDWETDAAPSMEDRPQGIVNRLLAEADLLIAVFWTRLGQSTGIAVSGTVEEIERHIAAGKPAMLYFSRRRIRPEQLDSAQYQALTKFKEDTQRRGLVAEYGGLSDLRAKLVKHLSQKLNRASGLVPVTSSILAGPKIYDRLGYRREEVFGRVQRSLILAGPNLRDWLSDPLARQGLVNLIKERSEVTVTFVLGTLSMLRELHGEGEAHLKASVVELDMMRSQLTTDQRQRMRCFFHWGAATLSAVFIDPESPSGVLFFTPRWGYDYNPRQRLTCMIEKRSNNDLFGFIYDPLLLLTQPSVTQLDEMLKLIGE